MDRPPDDEDRAPLPGDRVIEDPAPARPTTEGRRIVLLDGIRGLAVLGILGMNIRSFAMPEAAYENPLAWGDLEGLDGLWFVVSELFFAGKFFTLFSLLFGAGIVLMARRATARREAARLQGDERGTEPGPGAASLHYRRMAGLLVIGLAHAYGLWAGDILTPYAVTGSVAFLFWRLSIPWKATLAALGLAAFSALLVLVAWSLPFWPQEEYDAFVASDWRPGEEVLAEEVALYRSGWLEGLAGRSAATFELQQSLILVLPEILGLMLLGMVLLETGVLTGERSRRFYAWMAGLGLGLGLPGQGGALALHHARGWTVEPSLFLASAVGVWSNLLIALGYVGVLSSWVGGSLPVDGSSPASGKGARALRTLLAPVGRMALSCYLLQSILCTAIFHGWGLGLFGAVNRSGQALVFLAVSALQVVFARLWLRRLRFGPVEWLWRSATYGRWQPLRR